MIAAECFTPEWINRHREDRNFARINPPVVEKMIHAIALLEALVRCNLRFTFKGGTSLILLLPEPRRFSVDIDILTMHTRAELEVILNAVVAEGLFIRWELDEPRSYQEGIPKAHYFLHYNSQLNRQAGYVLIDVLYEEHRYPVVSPLPIRSRWISVNGDPLSVDIPSIESILGDKLTAFAPNTTGVPYGKNKSLEIVKQLHDVGHLFDHAQDITVVSQSFHNIVAQEIAYRELNITPNDVLDDIIGTAFLIGRTSKNHNNIETEQYQEIAKGMVQFGGYLMSGRYQIDHAIESAAKAAHLAARIKANNHEVLERYAGVDTDFQFKSAPYNTLNRLKRIRTGSMHHWSKTGLILGIE